ncbi:MAG: hypothetical protein F6K42_16580 [Leptolyngbya sp. SIO1D8]|nr:hypothetical protein [Leptolyngbya sp. SIO1D8]
MSTPSLVTWMLTPIDGGTQLQLHHSGLVSAVSPLHPVSLWQHQWSGSRFQSQSLTPQALLTFPSSHLQHEMARVVSPETCLEITFESDWNYRLNDTLPRVLTQRVTA